MSSSTNDKNLEKKTLKGPKYSSYKYIKYPPAPGTLTESLSGFELEQETPLITDLDLYHLGLQIKHLPIYKLLQTANKTVLTEDWQVISIKPLVLLRPFSLTLFLLVRQARIGNIEINWKI